MQLRIFIKIILLLFLTVGLGFVAFVYIYFDQYIVNPERLLNYKDKGVILTDRNDIPFYYINNAKKDDYVVLNDISPYLPKAIVAAEDHAFYHHGGVSFQGIVRSILLNFQTGSLSYGGSTITQQLVKNALLSPQKSISRKLEEAVLAFDVESKYTKDKIIEMYVNTIYYGDGAIGIKEASLMYFNKKPKDLTLPEAAYLAGMIKFPSLLSPFTGDIQRGTRIQEQVIRSMAEQNLITKEEEKEALGKTIAFSKGNNEKNNEAPHFALLVEDKLKEMYGNEVVYEGLKVKTSLDIEWQRFAQSVVESEVDKNAGNGVGNGAVVVMDPKNGEVLVLIGSKDWFNEQFGRVNMALAPRQPGSSFKPIVYSIAMDNGEITPATVLKDQPTKYLIDPNCHNSSLNCYYTPHDFDNRYRGPVTVRRALANSLNIPAVEVMNRVGVDTLLLKAPDFGITTLKDQSYYGSGLSLVLGSAEIPPIQMADAYATFANNGKRPEPVYILEVRDKFGNLKYQYQPVLHDVITPQAAYLITSILSDDAARREEFGNLLSTPIKAAVKTGTTENFRDAWTIGYTTNLVTAVWVGNNDARPIYNLPGSLAAAPIWKRIMEKFASGFKGFTQPDGIIATQYCDSTSSGSARLEYFIEGTQPASSCSGQKINLDFARGSQDKADSASRLPIEETPTPTTTTTPTIPSARTAEGRPPQ